MLRKLEEELIRMKQVEEEVEHTIKRAPEGTLRCSTSRGYYQYYKGKKYLDKNKREYIKQLAQKEYCLSIKNTVKKIKRSLEALIQIYRNEELEQLYRNLTPARKAVLEPIFKPVEEMNRRTGKRWIIEHLGMMDNPSYCESAMYKLDTYEKNGILLGDGLILLHETSNTPLNTIVMKRYIEHYFL